MEKLTKRELISKVSQHTNFRKDVVEEIIDGLVDVAAEEIVNKGEFSIFEFISITSKKWSKSYSINNNESVPSRPRLVIKVSERLRNLWKFRLDELDGEQGVITKDNWRDADISLRNQRKSLRKEQLRNSNSGGSEDSEDDTHSTANHDGTVPINQIPRIPTQPINPVVRNDDEAPF